MSTSMSLKDIGNQWVQQNREQLVPTLDVNAVIVGLVTYGSSFLVIVPQLARSSVPIPWNKSRNRFVATVLEVQ